MEKTLREAIAEAVGLFVNRDGSLRPCLRRGPWSEASRCHRRRCQGRCRGVGRVPVG
jgi:hypothetical protein